MQPLKRDQGCPFGSSRLADEKWRDPACSHGQGIQQAYRRDTKRAAHARYQHGRELRRKRAADDPKEPRAPGKPAGLEHAPAGRAVGERVQKLRARQASEGHRPRLG
jgi:hypothetical protein